MYQAKPYNQVTSLNEMTESKSGILQFIKIKVGCMISDKTYNQYIVYMKIFK